MRRIVSMLLAAGMAACALTPAFGPQDNPSRIEIVSGDRLRVLTQDGRRRMVTVLGANEFGLVARDETIAYGDLVFVEKQEFSGTNTALTAGAVVVVVLAAAAGVAGGYAAILDAGTPR